MPSALLLPLVLAAQLEIVGAGGVRLGATLDLPAGSDRVPAVLLIPGSGPTDRNGNQPGLRIDLLKTLSERLTAAGYATLRFDKRAVGTPLARDQWPTDPTALAAFFSWGNFRDDALAAVRFLKVQPRVDASRVVLLGHSEGGILAIEASAREPLAGLVLLATPGRPLGDLLLEQVERNVARLPPAQRDAIVESNRAAVEAYRAGRDYDGPVHPALRAVYNPSVRVYLREVVPLDPAVNLRRFAGPVFLGQGEEDTQVHPARDLPRLQEATPRDFVVRIPGASHNFKRFDRVGPFGPGFAGPVLEPLPRELIRWMRREIGPR